MIDVPQKTSELSAFHHGDAASDGAIDIAVSGQIDIQGGEFLAATSAAGRGPDILLSADGVGLADGESAVRIRGTEVSIGSLGAGDGGTFEIGAPTVEIGGPETNISALAVDSGAGSPILIRGSDGGAAETVTISDSATLFSQTRDAGPGGAIAIESAQVSVIGGAELISQSRTDGPGGAISITSNELHVRDDGLIVTQTTGSGSGGDIDLGRADAPIGTIEVADGGQVVTETTGTGAGGDIVAHADRFWIHNEAPGSDTFVFTLTRTDNAGPGGSIEIHATDVDVESGGQIFTLTDGMGQGGSLALVDVDTLRIQGEVEGAQAGVILPSSLAARVGGSAAGTGGGLSIDARVVEVLDGGEIASRTSGTGPSRTA